jgi:hypothetical protein
MGRFNSPTQSSIGHVLTVHTLKILDNLREILYSLHKGVGMRIRCLFAQRRESYHGEFAPELLAATDEFYLDENPEAFEEECRKQLDAMGVDCVGYAYFWIQLGSGTDAQDRIRAACLGENNELEGSLDGS